MEDCPWPSGVQQLTNESPIVGYAFPVLTQTSELGVKVLLYLGMQAQQGKLLTPSAIAEAIGTSPTYTAKICGQFARAGICRSQRGAAGGVMLNRDPAALTLLEIVETCQGKILADYCQAVTDQRRVCAYHAVMKELHDVITGTLQRCTLRDLLARPKPSKDPAVEGHCLITKDWPALRGFLDN
jgi:Rrf2 family protein